MNKLVILILIVIGIVAGFLFMGGDKATEPVVEDEVMVEDSSEAVVTEDEAEVMVEDEVEAVAEAKVFEVDSFAFGYSVDEISVSVGDTVRIELTNSDGFHDWVVDEFDAATEKINEGETTFVEFVATEAGEFEYYCSVGDHRAQGMVGKLIVEEVAMEVVEEVADETMSDDSADQEEFVVQ